MSTAQLVGRHVRLRGVLPNDGSFLTALFEDPEVQAGLRHRIGAAATDRLVSNFLAETFLAFIIARRTTREPVGFVFATRFEASVRRVYVGAALHREYRRRGWPLEALPVLAGYLDKEFQTPNWLIEVPSVTDIDCGRLERVGRLVRYGEIESSDLVDGRYVATVVGKLAIVGQA